MTSTAEKVAIAFEKVRRLNAGLWEHTDAYDKTFVERLQVVISALYKVETTIDEVDFEAEHLRGLIEVYDGGGRAQIYIRANQSEKWKHLVTVKELCHAILDRPEDWCPNPVETLGKLVLGEVLVLDHPENNGLRSETLAEMIGAELVYPHEFRRKDAEALRAQITTLAALSDKYLIPTEVISRILDSRYLAVCDYYWRMVTAPRTPPAE